MKFLRIGLILALGLIGASVAFAAIATDRLLEQLQPQGYVSDFAGVFRGSERSDLENFLVQVEQQTGSEIAVVTVQSMQGGEVDDFTNRLFAKWKVGKKGKDNGIMILASIEDRKVRIEVGYGVEGDIPDSVAGRIIREEMTPEFRQGRYGAGMSRGAQAVAGIVASKMGVQLTGAQPVRSASRAARQQNSPLTFFIIFGILICLAFITRGRRRSGYGYYGTGGGFSSGGGFSGGGGGGFGGFGGGSSGGGGASGSW